MTILFLIAVAGMALMAYVGYYIGKTSQERRISEIKDAYGRQLGSFSATGNIGNISDYPMRFIRAPYIEKILSDSVEILNITDEKITAVRYKNQLGISFHPELTDDLRIHQLFLSL